MTNSASFPGILCRYTYLGKILFRPKNGTNIITNSYGSPTTQLNFGQAIIDCAEFGTSDDTLARLVDSIDDIVIAGEIMASVPQPASRVSSAGVSNATDFCSLENFAKIGARWSKAVEGGDYSGAADIGIEQARWLDRCQ